MALLEVKNLTKHFDVSDGLVGRWFGNGKILKAVDEVSFAVSEGRTFGLVGESGCGKSTTARLIARLIPATAGEVYFSGQNILALPKSQLRQLRRDVQMIFQDPFASLNPRMRVADIIGRPLTIFFASRGQKKVDRVVELLEMVGLNADHLYRYPHEFSGGQRQRIGIARALAAEPKLIIADEPVSSLDVSVQAQVLNLLRRLQRDLRLTLLFISHDLNVVGYLADTVGVMYAGKIVEIAPVRSIFDAPRHPYTQALLAANTTIELTAKPAAPLDGEVLLAINPPLGCRLEPRCPVRLEKCRAIGPMLEEQPQDHWVACHVAGEKSRGLKE